MRRFAFLATGLTLLVIVILNIQSWLVLQRTSAVLHAELDNRLQGVALMLARSLSGRQNHPDNRQLISGVAQDHRLYNVFIVNESLEYLASLRDSARIGETDPTLELDAAEILAAFSGMPTQSQLYAAGDYYLASAYAPIESAPGMISAVLGVEADARYFSVLGRYRNSLLLINGLSLLAITAIALVSFGVTRHALRVEQAAARANSLALMGQLTGALAHEIKNPLGIIRAAAERLQHSARQSRPSAGDKPELQYITDEVDRLNRIIVNYLSLGKARPGELEALNLPELLSEILSSVSHEIKRAGIIAELKLQTLPPVTGNQLQLRQAFLNLILNAIQAQPEGGKLLITGRTLTAGRRGKSRVAIEIADHGPGISPKDRKRVFEPFFTTKEKGSGLGLFVVQQVVAAHHGSVTILKQSGAGTTVEVRLPV